VLTIPGTFASGLLANTTLRHLALVWLVFAVVDITLANVGADFAVADRLYQLEGNGWNWKDNIWLSAVLHEGGRGVSEAMGLATFVALAYACCSKAHRWLIRPLGYLFLSVALSTLSISILKGLTHMDCPWSLTRYGGETPFIGLLELRPLSLGSPQCFPAGHASAGYAWLALFFFLTVTAPRWRWWGLCFGLLMGIVFGVAQQLRGAHFLSHDIWTGVICWSVSSVLYIVMFIQTTHGSLING